MSLLIGRNRLQKVSESQQNLYLHHEKIYPREVHGKFAFFRLTGVVGLLGIYFLVPWLNWDNRQAVLFDLPGRKFFIFELVIWPQELYFLAALLVIAGVALFLFTAVAGRLWCGYSCPQTVWTEVFLWIERRVEGDRPRQMKLDQAALSFNKVWRKTVKHSAWLAVSIATAITFVGYFKPIDELCRELINLSLHPWPLFWVAFFTVATYVNAGWMREQICLYMCPYARFQSAMFDLDTLIISYDPTRGEPRGGRKRGIDHRAEGLGDCINCQMCVQVCPTGIDIRDGLQYECIGCAACVDACDGIMEKMNYPKGLIRYTTENLLSNRASRIFRPRSVIYSVILLALVAGVVFGLLNRSFVEFDVFRDRNVLYREVADGMIENVFSAHVINKDQRAHEYQFEVSGLGDPELLIDMQQTLVPAGEVSDVTLTIRANVDFHGSKEIIIRAVAIDDPQIESETEAIFIAP